jgi:hypothetical protein
MKMGLWKKSAKEGKGGRDHSTVRQQKQHQQSKRELRRE